MKGNKKRIRDAAPLVSIRGLLAINHS